MSRATDVINEWITDYEKVIVGCLDIGMEDELHRARDLTALCGMLRTLRAKIENEEEKQKDIFVEAMRQIVKHDVGQVDYFSYGEESDSFDCEECIAMQSIAKNVLIQVGEK